MQNFNRGRSDMKIYDTPSLEILLIEVSDIVTSSLGNVDGDNEFQDPFN